MMMRRTSTSVHGWKDDNGTGAVSTTSGGGAVVGFCRRQVCQRRFCRTWRFVEGFFCSGVCHSEVLSRKGLSESHWRTGAIKCIYFTTEKNIAITFMKDKFTY